MEGKNLDRSVASEVAKELQYVDEDHLLQEKISVKEMEFNEKCEPPHWLSEAESPFKWLKATPKTSVFFNRDVFIRDHKNKLGDGDPDNNFVRFSSLVALMTMTAVVWYQDLERDSQENDDSETIKKDYFYLEEDDFNDEEFEMENVYSKCEIILETLKEDEVFKRIGPSLEHVLHATRAQILYINGDIAGSMKIAQNLQPVEEMTHQNKAGLEGVKVHFIFAILKDTRRILELSKQLVKMDPNFGTWQFLNGQLIRRLRREFKENNCFEEIDSFERAYQLNGCLKHLLYVAQAYQEVSACHYQTKTSFLTPNTIRDMQTKSVDFFRKAWKTKNDTAAIARRVGNSLMKISPRYTDIALAKEALLKAVQLSPDMNTYHALGRFYYKLEKNDEKALECFEKAGNVFCGSGEIVRLKLIRDPLYDPFDIVQEWIQVVETQSKPHPLYCQIGWYYLTFRGDLEMAVQYFWKVLKEDSNSPFLTEFTSYTFCLYKPLNIIKLIINEILLCKKENEALPAKKQTDMEFLNRFLAKTTEKYPELGKLRPSFSQMQNIRRDMKNELEALRKKRYGNVSMAMRNYNTRDNRFGSHRDTYHVTDWRAENRNKRENQGE